jgi:hypothetical protein
MTICTILPNWDKTWLVEEKENKGIAQSWEDGITLLGPNDFANDA